MGTSNNMSMIECMVMGENGDLIVGKNEIKSLNI
jgi:hypothetical protein